MGPLAASLTMDNKEANMVYPTEIIQLLVDIIDLQQ